MAIAEFDAMHLSKLIGRQLTDGEIKERIPMLGCPFEGSQGNKLFFEIFPNRPDMFSTEGFARALRTFFGIDKGIRQYKVSKGNCILKVDRTVKDVRPHIACAIARGARLGVSEVTSLIQLQEKIDETMGRKRKKIAIGLHDFDKVTGPLTYKAAGRQEIRFVPLDFTQKMTPAEILSRHTKGIKYGHLLSGAQKIPLIVDSTGQVLSMPPIINGELTRVAHATKNLFIDVTGPHEEPLHEALNIICTSLADCGATIESVLVAGKASPDLRPKEIKVDAGYASRLLGVKLTSADFGGLLSRMGLGYKNGHALVPAYRNDVMHPIDIVEETAIAYGYQNFTPTLPMVYTTGESRADGRFYRLCCKLLENAGFMQTATMSLINEQDYAKSRIPASQNACKMRNSVSTECTICRTTILCGLLKTFSQNKHNTYPQKIYEVGEVLLADSRQETGAANPVMIAAGICDTHAGYEKLAGSLDALMASLGVKYRLVSGKHPCFIEGRAARITVGGADVGMIGEVHPQVLTNWNIERAAVILEMDADKLFACRTR